MSISDAEWYFKQSKASREFYKVFGTTCREYDVMWSEATPEVRECISELVRLTLERNAAARKLEAMTMEPNVQNKLIDIEAYPVAPVLDKLLQDKTTKQNIVFATDAYLENGFRETSQITTDVLLGSRKITIRPRVEKAMAEQFARTRKKAEVFTPSWIVNQMNNFCDEDMFGRKGVFNTEVGKQWVTNRSPVPFEGGLLTWTAYVDSRRLEITCGEAPYIASRYDTTTGKIIPVEDRIGILDRKLRVVHENASNDAEWLKWALRAVQSSYGYEFQGDNLLIARINVLITFVENYTLRFGLQPNEKLLQKLANIICWNFWQMDGLTGKVPCVAEPDYLQDVFFDFFKDDAAGREAPVCRIMDWRAGHSVSYDEIRNRSAA